MPMILDMHGRPFKREVSCTHGLNFDQAAAKDLPATEVRRRWPRLHGQCPHGCGYNGIAYASSAHYIMGDW